MTTTTEALHELDITPDALCLFLPDEEPLRVILRAPFGNWHEAGADERLAPTRSGRR